MERMRNQMMAGGKRSGWTWETRKAGTTRRRKTSEYSGALNGGEGRAPVSWHYDSLRKGTWLRRFVGEMMSSTIFKFLCFSGIWLPILRRMRLLITLKIKNNNKELAPLSMKLALCSLRGGTSSDPRARSVFLLEQGVISTGPPFVGKRMKQWVESAYTEISTW